MTLPLFETDRLILRPRSMADFDACIAMDRDPEVTRFVAGPWQDPPRHEAFTKTRITTDYGPGLGYWSIFPKASPEIFHGWILLIPIDAIGPEIEIGWRIPRISWGQGFATEAAQVIADHAMNTLRLDRIIAEIHPENHASINVATKIGMIETDRTPDAIIYARS
ncbi:GNAT family N-acetyltransferase [Paracoccus sp. SCSIO 75233]|uniref:GNAT family N-acetyltransferase n=1 Tax=Paracoccus sp. SCSIO 75233 TaxID=3017782 RepID=UPI0022F115E8|nr:GNAT family N-acetyltransferase [Paracoccus sp. SCSIO 75233]WBU53182.1 GNAT family N-acetyltransferase [Paracoccus sp. SCSIO 75233]